MAHADERRALKQEIDDLWALIRMRTSAVNLRAHKATLKDEGEIQALVERYQEMLNRLNALGGPLP